MNNKDKINGCAFFDLDGTIWNDKSVISFYKLFLDTKFDKNKSNSMWLDFNNELKIMTSKLATRDNLNKWFYNKYFKNFSIDLANQLSQIWWESNVDKQNFLIQPILKVIEYHKKSNLKIIIVTGSFREIITPLAKYISIDHALTAPLEEENGFYTGKLSDLPMIGKGKSEAVSSYIRDHDINPSLSYAYGDDRTDIPFLQLVENSFLITNGNIKKI